MFLQNISFVPGLATLPYYGSFMGTFRFLDTLHVTREGVFRRETNLPDGTEKDKGTVLSQSFDATV